MRPITSTPKYPPSPSHAFLDTSLYPHPSTIHLIRSHLSHHLPPELVDLILSYAEFWAHSTTTRDEPVRAFGPFTWGWREGDGIDYLKVWCPSGPGYAHRWRRWGESRRDDGFLLRSGPIGLEVEGEDGEGGGGGGGRWRARYLGKSRLVRFVVEMYQKSPTVAGLRMRFQCQRKKRVTNEMMASPSSRTAAVRKIIFETWSHQDYFGAVGDSTTTTADDDDEGAQQSPRVFCDVSINRKRDGATPRPRWKGRTLSWRLGGNAATDEISTSKDANDDDDNNNTNNNNNTKSGKHGTLITYKPFIIEPSTTPRCYFPRYHVHTWRWDDNGPPITPPNSHYHPAFPSPQAFLRQIEVGDTIGVWGRVGKGETYHIIDAMRMHVFWEV